MKLARLLMDEIGVLSDLPPHRPAPLHDGRAAPPDAHLVCETDPKHRRQSASPGLSTFFGLRRRKKLEAVRTMPESAANVRGQTA
jgi:hypothetical protein